MVFKAVQVNSGLSAEVRLMKDNQILSVAYINNNVTRGGGYEIYKCGKVLYRISYDVVRKCKNFVGPYRQRRVNPYKIFDANQLDMGRIYMRASNNFFLFQYLFYEMCFDGITYNMYGVGLGKEGMKFPIYIDEKQIALIEKDPTVRNNLDQYSILMKDDSNLEAVWLLCSYLDLIEYANRGEIVKKYTEKTYAITTNKELKSKYDPHFKEWCNS